MLHSEGSWIITGKCTVVRGQATASSTADTTNQMCQMYSKRIDSDGLLRFTVIQSTPLPNAASTAECLRPRRQLRSRHKCRGQAHRRPSCLRRLRDAVASQRHSADPAHVTVSAVGDVSRFGWALKRPAPLWCSCVGAGNRYNHVHEQLGRSGGEL